MRRYAMAAVLTIAAAGVVSAQKVTEIGMGKGGSPRVRVEGRVENANITIEYSRPALKGRVPGKDVDPYEGKEWRTGADEQTTLITDTPLMFGKVSVPAGRYGLHTIPMNGTWHLIIHKREKGWGIPYPGKEGEIGRIPMTMSKPAQQDERLTISVEDTGKGGMLHIDWGTTRASVPFTVNQM
jgi:hypothetical protein